MYYNSNKMAFRPKSEHSQLSEAFGSLQPHDEFRPPEIDEVEYDMDQVRRELKAHETKAFMFLQKLDLDTPADKRKCYEDQFENERKELDARLKNKFPVAWAKIHNEELPPGTTPAPRRDRSLEWDVDAVRRALEQHESIMHTQQQRLQTQLEGEQDVSAKETIKEKIDEQNKQYEELRKRLKSKFPKAWTELYPDESDNESDSSDSDEESEDGEGATWSFGDFWSRIVNVVRTYILS